jgi:hypothetical protein
MLNNMVAGVYLHTVLQFPCSAFVWFASKECVDPDTTAADTDARPHRRDIDTARV